MLPRTLTAALLSLAFLSVGASAASASTQTVKLLGPVVAHSYPGARAPQVSTIKATRPLTGAPTVLPVVGRAEADGRPWVRVLLPQRPNSASAWIPADGTQSGKTEWRVVIDRSSRKAEVRKGNRVVRRFSVVVGARKTPTPTGSFFVAERVPQPKGTATGPWALALSAYSNVLQEFAGGPGQIALHGRTGLRDPLGTAASHGCVRFDDSAIRWIAGHVSAGTPVTITN